MKTADRENPNRATAHHRAHVVAGPNSSRSFQWAAKQDKFKPRTWEMCFFLTSPYRTYQGLPQKEFCVSCAAHPVGGLSLLLPLAATRDSEESRLWLVLC